MATTIENFVLRFKTEGTNTIKNLADDLKSLGDQMNPLSNTLGGLTGKLGLLGTAALAGGAAFAALGLKAINLADGLADLSDATGIGADRLLNLKQSMMAAGGSSESFSKAATKLSVAIGESMSGNDKYQKSFKDLDIVIRDSNGNMRDSGDILQDVIGRLANIQDPAVRAAKAVELMGKEAAKIDWTKVSAGKDAITADQIKQLAGYRDEIDKFGASVETKLITSFGGLAKTMNQFFKEYDSQGFDAFLSRLQVASLRMSGFGQEANKLRAEFNAKVQADQKAQAENASEVTRLLNRTKTSTPAAVGDQGGLSPAKLKALAESRSRIKQSELDVAKQKELVGQNEIAQIEINAKYEALKAKEEITKKEQELGIKLTGEYAAKEKEIFAKRDADVAKARQQQYIKGFEVTQAQAEERKKAETALNEEQKKAIRQAEAQVQAVQKGNEELQGRLDLQNKIKDLGTIEQERATKLFETEKFRADELEKIRAIIGLPEDGVGGRIAREQELNQKIVDRIALINQEYDTRQSREQDYSAGVKEVMKRYEESFTPIKQGGMMAESVFNNMNSAIDNFVTTGKFKFGDFAASVVQDMIKIELKAMASGLLRGLLGSIFGGSQFIPGSSSFVGPMPQFRAAGGPAAANMPYIVGEQGPELFIPKSAGTVVPNGGGGSASGFGGTTVNYNIQAVDASSFKALVARDPQFIYSVTEKGRRSQPNRRYA